MYCVLEQPGAFEGVVNTRLSLFSLLQNGWYCLGVIQLLIRDDVSCHVGT
jgi:hypothetical protein